MKTLSEKTPTGFFTALTFYNLSICLLLCLFVRRSSAGIICCDSFLKNLDPEGKVGITEAKKCAEQVSHKDYNSNSSAKAILKECDVCTLKLYPWINNEEKFILSCESKKDVKNFDAEFGGVGNCQYNPLPTKEDEPYFNCACDDDNMCNKIKKDLEVPEDVWTIKPTKTTTILTCPDSKRKRVYDVYPNPSLKSNECGTGDDEKKMADKCVAKYELNFKDDGNPGTLEVECISDEKDVDDFMAKFPERVWKYSPQPKAKVLPGSTPEPKKPATDGATITFATISTQVLFYVLTWMISML